MTHDSQHDTYCQQLLRVTGTMYIQSIWRCYDDDSICYEKKHLAGFDLS